MADANETVETTLDRANRIYVGGQGTTLGILKEADANLSKRLHGLLKKPGAKDLRFTEAQALLYRAQIRLVTKYTEQRLLGHTHEQALKAVAHGVKDTVHLAKTLEKSFAGIAKPLQLDSQAMQDAVTRGTGASLLRQHQASAARYGTAMTADFERVMRTGALEGLSQHQVISRLVSTGELGGINAATLHASEPKSFPDPSGYVVRRYWAERIVRTEQSYAYNAANMATIAQAKVVDFPDLQKKILAHFDNRTAPDSIYVHGQIRDVEAMFCDGAGRLYKHPPARPNDRETVIPWRPHWTELPATHPPPPEAVAEAQVAAEAGLAPPGMAHNPVQASNAKIVALVEKAKAAQQVVAQSSQQAQVFQAAKAQAETSLLRGTQALGQAKVADAAAVAKAQAQAAAKGVKLPADLELLKAKAAQYKAEIEAKALAAVEQQKAAKAAALKVETQKHLKLLGEESGEMFDNPGPELVAHLKKLTKTHPELFAEIQKQMGAKTPLALAKKIAPEFDYSSFAPKKKAEPAPVEPPKPALPELTFKEVSGYIDIHDAKTGEKLAYLKTAPGGYGVTPPTNLGLAPKVFATKEEAAPYALEVSQAIKEAKAKAAAEQAVKHAEAAAKAKLSAAEQAKLAAEERAKPVKMLWSEKWHAPKRTPLSLADQAGTVDRGLAKPSRAGVAVAADGDWVEDFQISFTTEIRQGQRETVARFRVNDHRAGEVLETFKTKHAATVDNFPGYPKLKGLDNPELEFAGATGELKGKGPGVEMYKAKIHGKADVSYFRNTSGADAHPALANLMEVRFEEQTAPGKRWATFRETVKSLGIDPSSPTAESLTAYKRAKAMTTDKIATLQLGAAKSRTPAAVGKVWADAVQRDPRLQELVDSAELREVAPGHYALYSDKLAERYRATGVTHLKHNMSGGNEVIELMLSNEEAGLLSSRERFQRGLVFRGMSTDTDFGTGGADSVFVRLANGPGKRTGSGHVEVDPSELGRFDSYAFNYDAYGKAGDIANRMRLTDLEKIGAEGLASGNETMLRRAVSPWSIRRVLVSSGSKKALVEKLKERGVTEYGGVPIDELIQE